MLDAARKESGDLFGVSRCTGERIESPCVFEGFAQLFRLWDGIHAAKQNHVTGDP